MRSIAPAFAAYKLSAVFRCCWACGACGQRSCVVHKSTGLSLHGTQPEDKSALAKTAPSDNYPSARPPRLILIDAVLTQIVALYPKEAVSQLAGWVTGAIQVPEFRAKLIVQGFNPVGMCGADFATYLRKQYDAYGRIVREANIKAE